MPKRWTVYVLKSNRIYPKGYDPQRIRRTYTGMARPTKDKKKKKKYVTPEEDVRRRLNDHNNTTKGAKTTKSMRPLELTAYVTGFTKEGQALAFEKSIKTHLINDLSMTLIQKKVASLIKVLKLPKWMPYSDPAADTELTLHVFDASIPKTWTSDVPSYVSVVHHSSSSF